MKYIGIDYGSKRVGVAISDEGGTMAFPKVVISAGAQLVEKISELFKEEQVQSVVLGESKDFSGKDNPIMNDILSFKKALEERLNIDIILEPEFMTSREAEHIQGRGDMHDASAATLILQSYLDKQKAKNSK